MQQVAQRPFVPVGYRFNPTPEELIRYYLNPWVTSKTADFFPGGVVCVADIYALDPDALTSRFHHYGHDGNWYFLCVARWKGGKAGTRMNRCVQGGGTWHGSSKRKPVGRDGHRQGFEYRAAGKEKTVWIMEEFVTNLEEATDGEGVKVICKVYHSPRAPAPDEEEDNKVVVGSKRPDKQLLLHGEYDVERSYISSTSHQGGLLMMTDAGVKRARLDGEHGLAACSVPVAPSPTGYYAGTSQGMGVDGGVDIIHGKPEPLVPVESAGMEGLPVPPMDYGDFDVSDLGWQMNEWFPTGDFCFGATDGVEGGQDPTAAT